MFIFPLQNSVIYTSTKYNIQIFLENNDAYSVITHISRAHRVSDVLVGEFASQLQHQYDL